MTPGPLLALAAASFGGADWERRSGLLVGGEPVHLRLDALSALFLGLVCAIGGLGAGYAREYWSDHHYPASASRGRAWWSALLLSMGLVLTASNGLHFLMQSYIVYVLAALTLMGALVLAPGGP